MCVCVWNERRTCCFCSVSPSTCCFKHTQQASTRFPSQSSRSTAFWRANDVDGSVRFALWPSIEQQHFQFVLFLCILQTLTMCYCVYGHKFYLFFIVVQINLMIESQRKSLGGAFHVASITVCTVCCEKWLKIQYEKCQMQWLYLFSMVYCFNLITQNAWKFRKIGDGKTVDPHSCTGCTLFLCLIYAVDCFSISTFNEMPLNIFGTILNGMKMERIFQNVELIWHPEKGSPSWRGKRVKEEERESKRNYWNQWAL